MPRRQAIVIVGGGITGLTTAYYLQKEIDTRQLPYDIKLLEASDRLGGKIRTKRKDGFIIEQGPDSFLARKEPAVRLAQRLGLQNELVRNNTGQAYILIEQTLHKMLKGSFMGVPTDLQALQDAPLLSSEGKQRALLDLELPPSDAQGDQSLGSFFRRRFGDELVEHVIEPLLSGIYSGDIDEMSLLATFPDFYELEQQYGSIIKGLQQTREKPKRQTGQTPGQFYAFKNGLDTFVDELKKNIPSDVIHLNHHVSQIMYTNGTYDIQLANEQSLTADRVIMTTPHHVLPKVFQSLNVFDPFIDMPSTSVANVALAFDQSAIEQDVDGTGFVVSRNSPYRITACTWTHKKWPHTTPDGKALLRAYVGKPTDQDIVKASDEEIIETVLNDLRKTMTISREPEWTVVTRWQHVMPQYTVGHLDRLQNVRKSIAATLPGMFIAGSSYEGVGLPDCIGQAEAVVSKVLGDV